MKIISDYEKTANIRFSRDEKNRLKSDILLYVSKKKTKKNSSSMSIAELLNKKTDLHFYCASKEEYTKYAQAVIIYDLSYEEVVKTEIQALGVFYDQLHYLYLKKALIQHLYENGGIDEHSRIEIIKINEPPKIRY